MALKILTKYTRMRESTRTPKGCVAMKRILITIVSLMMVSPTAIAKEVGGKNLPDTIIAGKEILMLNGGGVRVKLAMDVYACGLYVKTKSQDAIKLLDADEPMAIKVQIILGLVNDSIMNDFLRAGFEKSSKGNLAPIQSRIEKMVYLLKSEYKQDDIFDFIYIPQEGITIYKNTRMLGTIKGLDFKKAFFGIWLGADPAQEDLKQAMLGKKKY